MGVGIGLRGTARDGFAGRFRETRDVSWMDAGRFADGGGTTSCAYMLNSIILRKIVDGGGSSTETRPGFGGDFLYFLVDRRRRLARAPYRLMSNPFPCNARSAYLPSSEDCQVSYEKSRRFHR